MSYTYKNLSVTKLSIIGAGQIGPDIALHFAKVFAGFDVKIIIVDILESALQNAKKKINKKISKGVETKAFKPKDAEFMTASISYTMDYNEIAGSNIVLEAATESEKIKDSIFRQVDSICDNKCFFFSNSSHMQPEVIFKSVKEQNRCAVIHYFFPAERNPIVEIIPSAKTDEELVDLLLGFYESVGKIPIKVKSSYGYAIDPIFEGLCQTAIMCLEKGYGTVKEIDKVAQDVLKLGVGPFTALNLTGGNPITNHGLDEMGEKLMPWFKSPQALQDAVKNNTPWATAGRDEVVTVPEEKADKLINEFMGAYFALASFIADLEICDISDINMACEIALVVKPPFTLMNKVGVDKAFSIVRNFYAEHPTFPIPKSLENAAAEGKWEIHNVVKTVKNNVAILKIRRPTVLNALNKALMTELKEYFEAIENDSDIIGAVLTGFGNKAFVSGADINELAACKSAEEGYNMCRHFHATSSFVENMKKPVVCAFNGFAFGGGSELAMACTARIALKNMPVAVCQPEVNLGFIPGSGGTQRMPRLIGVEKAAEILRTGRPVSSGEALELGLINKVAEGDLIDEAVDMVKNIYSGVLSIKRLPKEPLCNTGEPQQVEIGHLSKKIDEILVKSIYEGANMTLDEGLELEAKLFGECINTEDMKIGVENFKKNGPKAKAEFVNR